jgi:hypothetical protein
MAQFTSSTPNTFTPVASTTQMSNWNIQVNTVGQFAQVKMFNWGGASLTSTAYVTRWARISNTPVTAGGAYPIQNTGSSTVTPQATVNIYTGTPATATADSNLFKQAWNLLGGGGGIVLPIGGEWKMMGGALGTAFSQIGCGNITGADANASSYGLQWEE